MARRRKKYVIAGGGTGGHLFPALAIAQGLVEEGVGKEDIVFFGSRHSLEKDVVPREGFRLITFSGKGLNRGEHLKNIAHVFALLIAVVKAVCVLVRIRPRVVVGTGGYASMPAMAGAMLTHTPRVAHEQNAVVTRTNSLAVKLGAQLLTTFDPTAQADEHALLMGLPLRDDLSAKRSQTKTERVTITGGSMGAVSLNNAVIEMVRGGIDFPLTHVTGRNDFERCDALYEEFGADVDVRCFSEHIDDVYATSSVVVSRAGAGTCVELLSLGIPCVLVPLASAPKNHQVLNAHILEEHGLGHIILSSDLTPELLKETIASIISDPHRGSIHPDDFHINARRRIALWLIETYED